MSRRCSRFASRATTAEEFYDQLARAIAEPGPALIEEEASTTVIGPMDSAEIDAWGNIAIRVGEQS